MTRDYITCAIDKAAATDVLPKSRGISHIPAHACVQFGNAVVSARSGEHQVKIVWASPIKALDVNQNGRQRRNEVSLDFISCSKNTRANYGTFFMNKSFEIQPSGFLKFEERMSSPSRCRRHDSYSVVVMKNLK